MANDPLDSPEEYARLAKSEQLYRHLVEESLGLICSHDLAGILLTINSAAASSLGYQPAELIGHNLRELIPSPVHPRFQAYLQRIQRNGRARGYLDLTRRDGAVVTWLYRNQRYVDSPSSPPIIIGHAQDVTWRLQMERSLKDSTERFRALFEDAPVAYHEIDLRGVITRVNRAECELLGYTKQELLGRRVWELVVAEQRDESRENVNRKLLGVQPLAPFLRDYTRKDGTRLTLHIYEKPIRSNAGRICGIRSTLLDVTAQLRVEAELRTLNAELDRRVASRTAELNASNERLGEFVYTVSHDLQEPLRSISSFGSLLRQRYSGVLDQDGLEFLDYVISGASRMTLLIRDLLAYSRVLHDEEELFEPVDLNAILATVCENLSTSIDASGATIVSERLPVVSASPTRMTQLIQNLLSNAIKYRSEAPLQIYVTATSAQDFCEMTVQDNGVGIREEECERIFGLFKRAHGSSPTSGSGVGLAICRAIVERHGGRIWVEPVPGGGSAFRFTLVALPALEKTRTAS